MNATQEQTQVALWTRYGEVTLTVTGKESAHVTGDLMINRIPYRVTMHFKRGDQYQGDQEWAQRWRREAGATIRRMDRNRPFGSMDGYTSAASSFVYGDLMRQCCKELEANTAIVAADERSEVERKIENLRTDIAASEAKLTALRDELAALAANA